MDLSKLSDADLIALHRGDLSKVSDDGLRMLHGQSAGAQNEVVKPQSSMLEALGGSIGQGVGNIALGAQNLVGMGLDKLGANQIGQWLQKDATQGKTKLQSEIQPHEDQYPLTVAGGRLGGEVLSTLPVGGILAKGLSAVAPKVAPGLVEALRTSGMSTGGANGLTAGQQLSQRIIGGGVSGASQSALMNQDDAGIGAAIGSGIPILGKAAGLAGALGKKFLGGTTGVGEEALSQALRAGKEGGKAAESFKDAMRNGANMEDVLSSAKENLSAMNSQKQSAYRSGMIDIKADKTVLDLSNVDKAVNDALGMATFKGQVKNEKAAAALSEIKKDIENWKSLDPSEFHTPEGFDALKQKIGGIVESIPYEQKTARAAAGNVYNSIKNEIESQAPKYSEVMSGYSKASDTIKEIERALSLGQKASADTAVRKLQSLMRNNVNTNYGGRDALARQLEQAGGNEIMPTLAGQALNDFIPRGIQRATSGGTAATLGVMGNIPAAAVMTAISSPRLMGELMYGAGKMSNSTLADILKSGAYRSPPTIVTDRKTQR
jgi:hypothetical protein